MALPALAALAAEPLFLFADSAIVGHLGTAQLAGLAVASAILLNAVFLCIFLSYGTTAVVARRAGAGAVREAFERGVDGMYLGALVGVVLAGVGIPLAPALIDLFRVSESAAPYAVTYLRISLIGLPSMLVLLASTGVMRGLKDTRTPLAVTGVSAVANILLNLLLVFQVGLGIAGSALGTVLAQTAAAAWLSGRVLHGARSHTARIRPHGSGILDAAKASVPLITQTALLRVAVLTMTFVATAQGDVGLAGHQIAYTVWFLLAIPPEAFGIAGQAMVGHAVGASDAAQARKLARRIIAWGVAGGLGLGVLVFALRPLYLPIFTTDPAVRHVAWSLAAVVAATQPVGAVVYVLEAVLIGAGDACYLAWAMLAALLVFIPLAAAVLVTKAGVVALWWALAAWLLTRALAVVPRYRSGAWLRAAAVVRR